MAHSPSHALPTPPNHEGNKLHEGTDLREGTGPRSARHARVVTLLWMLLALFAGSLVAGWGGWMLHDSTSGSLASLAADNRIPMLVVVLGALIAIGGAMLALGAHVARSINIVRVSQVRRALFVGIAWGFAAVGIAAAVELASRHLPSPWDSGALNLMLAGPIEEAAKLLLPVALLAFVPRWRDPKLGFWLVFSAGATFGVVEGLGYVVHDALVFLKSGDTAVEHAAAAAVGAVSRAGVELLHPVITGGAAAIIWLAAAHLSRGRAIAVGIAAYLAASALHGFNDAVIGVYVAEVNTYLSVLACFAFLAVVAHLWLAPQLRRLNASAPTSTPASAPAPGHVGSPRSQHGRH